MTKIKDLPPLNENIFQAQANSEPSFTNLISPRQPTYMDSDCSPGSAYSSDYILNPATKIPISFGHGLLSQVQKMQSLLEEYQNSFTAMEIEKADHQQEINKLESRLKSKGSTEEKYKEDIWNLELKNQELYQRINDLTHQLSRSQLDQTRFLRQESQLIQDLDQLKAQHQIWQQTIQESHSLEVTCLKKSLHTIRLEKENLFNQLQQKASVIEPNKLTDHMPVTPDTALSLPTLSNYIHPTHITVLQTSLTEAHDLIETMQQKLDLERDERIEIDKLLREAQETIENYGSITSPTLSVHSNCHHISSFNHHPHHPHQGCRKNSISAAAALGKSLGDELSLATSLPNLTAPITNTVDHHQQGTRQKKKKSNQIELSLVQLPSQSNFFSTSPNTSIQSVEDEDSNYNQDIEQYAKTDQQQYGSLLKKPESYFYKSIRKESPEKQQQQMTPSILFASNTTDNILNTNHLELFPNIVEPKNTIAVEDGSVTALTRTMIGDWMWKHTRKVVGSGISENRHRRFFWIHPYTQTLYWSSKEPGSSAGTSNTKSALVESFVLLPYDNKREKSCPPCILIQTPLRGLKVECIDMSSHDAWIKSLQFILADNTRPRLSQLGDVSKRHYLNRKKSRQDSLFPIAHEPDSNMFNNSTLVDVTTNSSNNNFLLKL